jgi:catechol 2,3-dioxygenase
MSRTFAGHISMNKPVNIEKEALQFPTIDAGVRIGHVHLKVADLQRALDFYCGVLGFELTTSRPGAAFISAGGYHHHIGLNTGRASAARHPRPGPPASTTPRSFTRPGACSPTRCAG